MSARLGDQTSVSRQEFELLQAELYKCRAEVATLKARVAALEGESGFELVSSPPGTESAATSSDRISSERSEIAAGIGEWIRKALQGERRGLSGRERIAQQSRIYLIFKDLHGTVHNPPLSFELWREAKVHCTVGGHSANDSIFVGLPSKAEARIVVSSARVSLPASLQ